MEQRLSQDELLKLYTIDKRYRWMKVLNDEDEDSEDFHVYQNVKKRLIKIIEYVDFSKNDKIVDFGCGNGLLLDVISNKIHYFAGVDFAEDFIKLAKERRDANAITNAEFYCEDINVFCKNNQEKFDKAFSLDFSEHIYDEDFLKIFSSILQSLVPKGKLYIHTPNRDFIIEKLKEYGILKQFEEHIGVRNGNQYKALLNQVGFTSITCHYLPHYISGLSKLHLLSHLPLVGKLFQARLLIECVK